jgi:hypothetical protein
MGGGCVETLRSEDWGEVEGQLPSQTRIAAISGTASQDKPHLAAAE